MKLTNKTLVSSPEPLSEAFNALCRNLRMSQFELAPKTLVSRIRDAFGGRVR
jgi:hypothetical protein